MNHRIFKKDIYRWKTNVCNRPVSSAAPAVVVRSRKKGIEIKRRFMSRCPSGADGKAMLEQCARGGRPGEAARPLATGR